MDPGAYDPVVSDMAIEPTFAAEIPIIDPHHHFADHGNRYLFHDYLDDTKSGHNIVGSVYVENRVMCRAGGPEWLKPVGETEFANGVAAMSASGHYGPSRVCAGIVSYADLRDARLDELLEAHAVAAGGRFRGVRQVGLWHQDPEIEKIRTRQDTPPSLMADPAFRNGYRRLMAKGFTFDVTIYHTQLGELIDLLRAGGDGRVVLDHLGIALGIAAYADRRDEVFHSWRSHLLRAAEYPNLFIKIGGLGLPLWGFRFERRPPTSDELAAAWRPYVETAIELFGPSRCMFESNFPQDRCTTDFHTLWNAFKKITRFYSAAEKKSMFSGSAADFYNLDISSKREG